MKKVIVFVVLCSALSVKGQDLNDLFIAGIEDAERFSDAYFAPLQEATIYSLSSGWYNTAEVKPLGGFEISIIGNLTFFDNLDDKKAFVLDPNDYDNLDFLENPGQAREVSTALGDIEGVVVIVSSDDTGLVREEFELPSGLASEDFSFLPMPILQASVGLVKGFEVKARFLPTISIDEAEVGMFGAGLQYEFTKLLPADKILPVAISAVIGYTNLNGEYDFTESSDVQGENQRVDASFNTWNFSAVVSTKNIPVINFYGGIGYITGSSDVDLKGTYDVTAGPFITETYIDPFTVSQDASGVVANIGTKIKLGFFRLNAEYNIGEFNTLSAGINFGFR